MLAKVAADMHKPDGLTLIRSSELPGRLYGLALTDFPGIGPRMERRLHRAGVATVAQLCALSERRLAAIWGSRVLGRLGGIGCAARTWARRPAGGARSATLRAAAGAAPRGGGAGHAGRPAPQGGGPPVRLGYWAGLMELAVDYLDRGPWRLGRRLGVCRDTPTLVRVLGEMWTCRPPGQMLRVGVTLGNLVAEQAVAAPLFPEEQRHLALSEAMDRLNECFGGGTVYFGGAHLARGRIPTRIAFTTIPDI